MKWQNTRLFLCRKLKESRRRRTTIRRIDRSHSIRQRHLKHLQVIFSSLPNQLNRNFSMEKKVKGCRCCCCHHRKSGCNKSSQTSADESELKSDQSGCEICGQNISPKEFGGVKRLRCPCHVAGAYGDGVFPSHSTEILGIHVSQSSCRFGYLCFFFFFFKWSIPIHRPAARRRCRRRWKRPWQETVTESEISMVGLAPSTVDNQRWRGRETLHVAFETESAPHSGHLLPGNVWFKSSKIFLNECQRSQPTVLCIRETHRTRIFISLTINWQTICYRAHTSIQHIFILFFLGSFNLCCPSVEHPNFFFFY